MQHPALRDRALRQAVRLLGILPEWAQRRIAGPPVVIDGNTLYTEVQAALRLLNAAPDSSFERLPLARAREQIDAEAWVFGAVTPVDEVEDFTIPTRAGSVPARRYVADRQAPPRGVLVYYHGGGWVVGSLESGDSVCRFLARHSGLTVIAVDYRLAPEHPFPAAVDDGTDAFRWVRDHAADWGVDAGRIAVGGDSAGGNLAAVAALDARDDPEGAPAFQLLFFPVTDLSSKHRSYSLFSDGYFLTEAQMDWYREHYLPDASRALDPRASPLLAPDLSGLAPAYVAVSGFDVLRDEGTAYADRLRDAGVEVEFFLHSGQVHGSVNASGVGKTGRVGLLRAADALVRAFPSAVPASH